MNEQVTNGDRVIGKLRKIREDTKRDKTKDFIDYLLQNPDERIPAMLSTVTSLMYSDESTMIVMLKLILKKRAQDDKP